MAPLSRFVTFRDEALARRYAARPMPMAILLEAYLDGGLDIADMEMLLDARRELLAFTLTWGHLKFFLTRMIPEWLIHSRAQDARIVRDHYDRGDDFFEAFLGETHSTGSEHPIDTVLPPDHVSGSNARHRWRSAAVRHAFARVDRRRLKPRMAGKGLGGIPSGFFRPVKP